MRSSPTDFLVRSWLSPATSSFCHHLPISEGIHIAIGWMAYRLFHLLSPDVQRAFLASSDVRWTILVGAIWVVGLLFVASTLILRLVNAHVSAPIADLARVSESVANGELAVPFVPSTANNERRSAESGDLLGSSSCPPPACGDHADVGSRYHCSRVVNKQRSWRICMGKATDSRHLKRIKPGIKGYGANDPRDRRGRRQARRGLLIASGPSSGRPST